MLILWSIKNVDSLCLLSFKVGLPDHCKRVTTSSSKIVTIFRESTCISTSVMPIQSVLENTLIDFPDFNLRVKRGGDHIVILGMKVDFGHWLSMSIIILN